MGEQNRRQERCGIAKGNDVAFSLGDEEDGSSLTLEDSQLL